MHSELEDINLFENNLAKHIQVLEEGFSQEDQLLISMYVDEIISGRIDAIAVSLAKGVTFTKELSDRVLEQLDEIFGPHSPDEPLELHFSQANYSGLHVDAERSLYGGDYLNDVTIRIHCNPGQHNLVNCPPDKIGRDFEPFIVFGRVAKLEIYPQTLTQSYETFTPSLAVNLMNPVWNIFRAHGRHHRGAPNAPVAHAVIPRILATDVLDPDAKFTELANGDRQQVSVNGKSKRITPHKDSPFVDELGSAYGFSREFQLVNYVIVPSGDSPGSFVSQR